MICPKCNAEHDDDDGELELCLECWDKLLLEMGEELNAHLLLIEHARRLAAKSTLRF